MPVNTLSMLDETVDTTGACEVLPWIIEHSIAVLVDNVLSVQVPFGSRDCVVCQHMLNLWSTLYDIQGELCCGNPPTACSRSTRKIGLRYDENKLFQPAVRAMLGANRRVISQAVGLRQMTWQDLLGRPDDFACANRKDWFSISAISNLMLVMPIPILR